MELRHLRSFVAVAEERHFGRAASRLHIAQPPLSQQIRQLEDDLGVQLLSRTTRKVELTSAGSAYLVRVRAILAEINGAGVEAERVAAGLQGRLVVGCVGSATYSLLPAFASTLHAELPDVELVLRGEMLVPQLVSTLVARDVDLAVLRPPVDEPGVRIAPLRTDRLIVAMPEGHPLAARRQLKVTDLRGHDLIAHPARGSVMYGTVVSLCRDAGFEPRVQHEVAETSTLVTFVAAGLGLAVVPAPVAALGIAGATYRPLVGRRARVDLVAAVRADDDSPALSRALGVLSQLARQS